MLQSTLYFGLRRRSGAVVTAGEWAAFLSTEVTPRFPDGLTVLSGEGQWRGADGLVRREPSRVVVLLHPNDASARLGIRSIISHYRQEYDQESVLWETSATCARF